MDTFIDNKTLSIVDKSWKYALDNSFTYIKNFIIEDNKVVFLLIILLKFANSTIALGSSDNITIILSDL